MKLLEGSTALVTGGARGIGFEIAKAFIEHGGRVAICDVDGTQAQQAAATLGGSAVAVGLACDVRDGEQVRGTVESVVAELGGLDVMVNNAGITRDATLRRMTDEEFDDVIGVNLKGTWNGMRHAAAVMREAGSGSIINISSLSGKVGLVGQTNYSAAKAGVIGMTKAAAKELAHVGVRVNAVQPGLIRSAMTEQMPERVWEQKLAEIPMGRAGSPDEVASVCVFYASTLSSYMTGTVAEVTGGRLM
jgi:3-oxoacyl-[acyl-carrier protein] reductase